MPGDDPWGDEEKLSDRDWERQFQLKTLRQAGEEPVDRQGRLRVDIGGDSPEALLARSIVKPRQRKPVGLTEEISAEEFLRLYKAVAFANLMFRQLDTFLTVSWSTVGIVGDLHIDNAHKQLLRYMRDWSARQGIPHALIWVKERSARLGVHSHVLVHMPREWRGAFGTNIKKFVERFAGQQVAADVPDEQGKRLSTLYLADCGARVETWRQGVDYQWRVFRYLMKGASREEWLGVVRPGQARTLLKDAARLALRPQGEVAGKRLGYSTTLGATAWRRFAQANRWAEDYLDRSSLREIAYDDRFYARAEIEWALASLDI